MGLLRRLWRELLKPHPLGSRMREAIGFHRRRVPAEGGGVFLLEIAEAFEALLDHGPVLVGVDVLAG